VRPNEIRTVFEYGYWAFDKVWDCANQLTDEQFVQELGYSRGSIRNQIIHMMSATQRWIIRLRGGTPGPHLAYEDFSTRAATKAKWDELRGEALKYVSSLTDADLDGVIHWTLPDRGAEADNTRWEILLHVVNHATDHRAQILAMLNQQFGIQTVEQDLLFYLRERKGQS
jgi:uncharacterized damage-inducible protein DinB